MSLYPGQFDQFPNNQDGPGNTILAAIINAVQSAISAVQGILGINPQGAFTTVSDRIAALESGGGGLTAAIASDDVVLPGAGAQTFTVVPAFTPKAITSCYVADTDGNVLMNGTGFIPVLIDIADLAFVTQSYAPGAYIDGVNLKLKIAAGLGLTNNAKIVFLYVY